MPFVRRDHQGQVSAVFREREPSATEYLPAEHPEVTGFVMLGDATDPRAADLVRSDLELIRVFEDLIDSLIVKKIILLTDLPPAAQLKLMRRRSLRGAFSYISEALPSEDEDDLS